MLAWGESDDFPLHPDTFVFFAEKTSPRAVFPAVGFSFAMAPALRRAEAAVEEPDDWIDVLSEQQPATPSAMATQRPANSIAFRVFIFFSC